MTLYVDRPPVGTQPHGKTTRASRQYLVSPILWFSRALQQEYDPVYAVPANTLKEINILDVFPNTKDGSTRLSTPSENHRVAGRRKGRCWLQGEVL